MHEAEASCHEAKAGFFLPQGRGLNIPALSWTEVPADTGFMEWLEKLDKIVCIIEEFHALQINEEYFK